jgi:hypothetical protein
MTKLERLNKLGFKVWDATNRNQRYGPEEGYGVITFNNPNPVAHYNGYNDSIELHGFPHPKNWGAPSLAPLGGTEGYLDYVENYIGALEILTREGILFVRPILGSLVPEISEISKYFENASKKMEELSRRAGKLDSPEASIKE